MGIWSRTSMVAAVVLLAPACGKGEGLPPGRYAATAVIQVLPPETGPAGPGGDARAPVSYDVWLATELERLVMPEALQLAVRESNLTPQPDFRGKSEPEIVRMLLGHVAARRRLGTYLVDITVTGDDPRPLDDLANALAERFRAEQRMRSRRLRDGARARADEEVATADTMIRLLSIDRANALKGAGLTEATLQDALEIGPRRRSEYMIQIDAVTRRLIEAEAAGAPVEVRTALEKQRQGYTAELGRLQAEAQQLAEVKGRIDRFDAELATWRAQRAAASRERDAIARGAMDERDNVRVESRAAEPSAERR